MNKSATESFVDRVMKDDPVTGDVIRKAAAELGLFDVSTLKEPYRVEGKKTMVFLP